MSHVAVDRSDEGGDHLSTGKTGVESMVGGGLEGSKAFKDVAGVVVRRFVDEEMRTIGGVEELVNHANGWTSSPEGEDAQIPGEVGRRHHGGGGEVGHLEGEILGVNRGVVDEGSGDRWCDCWRSSGIVVVVGSWVGHGLRVVWNRRIVRRMSSSAKPGKIARNGRTETVIFGFRATVRAKSGRL